MKALEKADPGTVDAAYSLCARVERVESPWVRGFAFLVQTTQEESGDFPNNRELTYQFLGITRDGAYFVAATFAVNHASILKECLHERSKATGQRAPVGGLRREFVPAAAIPIEGGYSLYGRCRLELGK